MSKKSALEKTFCCLNAVILVFGLITAALGICFYFYTLYYIKQWLGQVDLLPRYIDWQVVLLILMSILTTFTSMCGLFFDASKRSWLLIVYCIAMLIIMVFYIVAATLIFWIVNGDHTERFIGALFQKGIYNSVAESSFRTIEGELSCCGVYGASDYPGPTMSSNYGCEGCATVVSAHVKTIDSCVAGVLLLFAVMEFACVVIASKLLPFEHDYHLTL